jgi:Cys-tRNA(Pro)/Cys-tRNA(Cys) deacylase
MPKTNAARILDAAKIRYELREYEVDPQDLSAETVAAKVGLPLAQVWKTLLARGDRHGCVFAIVAAGDELDPKLLAKATSDKKCDLVPLKEVEPLTGYVRGGVTVLGAKKAFPVLADPAILEHEVISVSAGVRGTQVLLAPKDYVRVTAARLAPLTRRSAERADSG